LLSNYTFKEIGYAGILQVIKITDKGSLHRDMKISVEYEVIRTTLEYLRSRGNE